MPWWSSMSTLLSPSNTLNPEGQVSSLVVNTLCVLSHVVTETSKHCLHNVTEREKQKFPCLRLPQALPFALLRLADCILNSFAVINHNPE